MYASVHERNDLCLSFVRSLSISIFISFIRLCCLVSVVYENTFTLTHTHIQSVCFVWLCRKDSFKCHTIPFQNSCLNCFITVCKCLFFRLFSVCSLFILVTGFKLLVANIHENVQPSFALDFLSLSMLFFSLFSFHSSRNNHENIVCVNIKRPSIPKRK